MSDEQKLHDPVLLDQALQLIAPRAGEKYLDLTAGYGGHAAAFLSVTGNFQEAVLVDRDAFAIANLQKFTKADARLIHDSFKNATEQLISEGKKFDIIFMDLGVSSPQLDQPDRGFSFNKSGPLDMRMDQKQSKTAYQIVNEYSETKLTEIFVSFGEEKRPRAKKIAQAIVNSRPIQTTDELAELVSKYVWQKSRTKHPATRVFQSIRIAVNDEIEEISHTISQIHKLLAPGGRVGIISFHSLEDRLVKSYFNSDADLGLESKFQILTKKPIAGDIYDVHNPRARSAKLRVALKK